MWLQLTSMTEGDPVWFPSFTDVEKHFTASHLKCIAKMLPCLGCIEKVYKETRWLKLEGSHWLLRLWIFFFFYYFSLFSKIFSMPVYYFSQNHIIKIYFKHIHTHTHTLKIEWKHTKSIHPDAGKNWRWEEKGTTEDEMVRCHYRFNRHESE